MYCIKYIVHKSWECYLIWIVLLQFSALSFWNLHQRLPVFVTVSILITPIIFMQHLNNNGYQHQHSSQWPLVRERERERFYKKGKKEKRAIHLGTVRALAKQMLTFIKPSSTASSPSSFEGKKCIELGLYDSSLGSKSFKFKNSLLIITCTVAFDGIKFMGMLCILQHSVLAI